MTADFLFCLLLGHLIGDYLLQNEWMALNKSRKDTELPGFVHALVYTLAVVGMTYQSTDTLEYTRVWAIVVFLSHWPVDRYSLAEKWLKLIGGRTLEGFHLHGNEHIPPADIPVPKREDYPEDVLPLIITRDVLLQIWEHRIKEAEANYRILRGGFHALVYTVTDNTMHLLLLYLGWTFLQGGV